MANTYLTRLNAEHAELSTRLKSLKAFIGTEAFNKIVTEEKARLHLQAAIMEQLADVLAQRIAFNTGLEDNE